MKGVTSCYAFCFYGTYSIAIVLCILLNILELFFKIIQHL